MSVSLPNISGVAVGRVLTDLEQKYAGGMKASDLVKESVASTDHNYAKTLLLIATDFGAIDTNKDGKLNASELIKASGANRIFEKTDFDQDADTIFNVLKGWGDTAWTNRNFKNAEAFYGMAFEMNTSDLMAGTRYVAALRSYDVNGDGTIDQKDAKANSAAADNALKIMENAQPNNPSVQMARASYLFAAGEYAKARQAFNKVIANSASNADTKASANAYIASAFLREGNESAALTYVNQAQSFDGDNIQAARLESQTYASLSKEAKSEADKLRYGRLAIQNIKQAIAYVEADKAQQPGVKEHFRYLHNQMLGKYCFDLIDLVPSGERKSMIQQALNAYTESNKHIQADTLLTADQKKAQKEKNDEQIKKLNSKLAAS